MAINRRDTAAETKKHPPDPHLSGVIASGYDIACSCGAEWQTNSIESTTCPDCGTEYDNVTVAEAADHAY